MRRPAPARAARGPCALIVAVGLLGTLVSASSEGYFVDTLVKVSIVVALYVFIGNSGGCRSGTSASSRSASGRPACCAVPVGEKPAIMPNLAHFLRSDDGRERPVAAARRARRRCVRARRRPRADAPLGPRSGHRDVRRPRDHPQRAAVLREDRAGLNTFSSVPETTGLLQASIGALIAICIAFAYQRSRFGRMCARRARTRPPRRRSASPSIVSASALSSFPVRLPARRRPLRAPAADEHRFALSRPHVPHARDVRRRRCDEPLGRGGRSVAVSALDSFLAQAENGVTSSAARSTCRQARAGRRRRLDGRRAHPRPSGLTGGREFALARRRA